MWQRRKVAPHIKRESDDAPRAELLSKQILKHKSVTLSKCDGASNSVAAGRFISLSPRGGNLI